MSLSPQVLLSKKFRERYVAKIKELPNFAFDTSSTNLQYASVLIPLCVRDGEVHILYTLRSTNLKSHSGQVSFPGGKSDGNESLVETALRETEEEIGVPRESVDVWGVISNVSGLNRDMIITPVVGEIKDFDFSKLTPNADEVEEVFTVPVRSLCDINTHGHYLYLNNPMPMYIYGKHKIWGITGFITHVFLLNFLPSELYSFNFKGARYDLEELRLSKL